MKHLSTAVLLLTLAQASLAQLSGPLSGTLGPGTFYIVGDISVESEDSLRLVAGTIFHFDGPYPFEIYGRLFAEGTASDAIIFTTDTLSNPDRWRGIRFLDSTSSGSELVYCIIELCSNLDGGGVYCEGASPSFAKCTFSRNRATGGGGGITCFLDASPTFTDCTIRDNTAALYGGGMMCSYSSPDFRRCKFTNNGAWKGGAMFCWRASPTFLNCLFVKNSAETEGGGISCERESFPEFNHCTFSGNSAEGDGGGLYCDGCSPSLRNSIVAFSSGVGFYFNGSAASEIEYCDFYGNAGGNFAFSGGDSTEGPTAIGVLTETNNNGYPCDIYSNIFFNPLFTDVEGGDYTLTQNSYCIGSADPYFPTSDDIEGNIRPNPPLTMPDVGAYESEHGTAGRLCGTLAGFLVFGIYHVVCPILVDAEDTLTIEPGTTIYFDESYSFDIFGTLIAEGTLSSRIVFSADRSLNPVGWEGLRFLDSTSTGSRLIFCIVENGNVTSGRFEGGGGVYIEESSPDFAHCMFNNNTAGTGGGVSCWESSSEFYDCTFDGNTAMTGGGVACGGNDSPNFVYCAFKNNLATSHGGGAYSWWGASPQFTNCVFSSNTAYWNGGAAASVGSQMLHITNCTFHSNTAGNFGGGVYCEYTSAQINSASISYSIGAGIYFGGGVDIRIEYSDFFANSVPFAGDVPDELGELMTTNANGDSCDTFINIYLEPMFVNAADNDFHLLENSPCIDAGDPSLPDDPDETVADIGAFYYHQVHAEPLAKLLPTVYALHPNWPNPFNPTTTIRYDVPQTGQVRLTIYDLLGREVACLADRCHLAGSYTVIWNADGLPTGIYFCRMEASKFVQARKLLLVK